MALIEDTIIAAIIDEYEAAKKIPGTSEWAAYQAAARAVGVSTAEVKQHVVALRSTVRLAKMRLLAKSSAMVDKIIDKAPTGELIDILSRPNVGVLEPAQKGAQGAGGFILSVAMDSCGAVRATAAMLPDTQPPQLEETVYAESQSPERPHAITGRTTAADAIRERLAAARDAATDAGIVGRSDAAEGGEERGHSRHQRVRGADDEAPSRAVGTSRSKIHLRDAHESFDQV